MGSEETAKKIASFLRKTLLIYGYCRQLGDDAVVIKKDDSYHILKYNPDGDDPIPVMTLPADKSSILPVSTDGHVGGIMIYDYIGHARARLFGTDLNELHYGNTWKLSPDLILAEKRSHTHTNGLEDFSFMVFDFSANPPASFDWPWEFDEVELPDVVIDAEIGKHDSSIGSIYVISSMKHNECAVVVPAEKVNAPPGLPHETYDRYFSDLCAYFSKNVIAIETAANRGGIIERDYHLINLEKISNSDAVQVYENAVIAEKITPDGDTFEIIKSDGAVDGPFRKTTIEPIVISWRYF